MKLLHKGLILVLVPLAMQLVFIAVLWHLVAQSDYQTRRLSHAKEVSLRLNVFLQNCMDAGRAAALFKYTRNPEHRKEVAAHLKQVFDNMQTLRVLTASDPEEKAAFEKLQPATKDMLILIEDGMRKLDQRELLPQIAITNLTRQITECAGNVQQAAQLLADFEGRVESEAPLVEARSRELVMSFIAFGVIFDVVVAIGLAVFFNKQLLNRLIVMMENTRRLAANKPLLPATAGGDEIAHLDRVFHEMAQALNEAAEYKKELVAMVSHDLRTPLTSIQTSLALIEVGACGEVPERALNEIAVAERSATRLINLINDLLDIEKMEAGKLEMNIQTAQSKDIFDRSMEGVASFAEQHKIIIKAPAKEFEFQADADRLVQVLINLMSNAIKFSPDGTTITLDVHDEPADLRFSVTDEGPGIPPEYQKSLFERFKQVEGIGSTKMKGTGLGLAICKAIVQGHGGEIGVDSEVGKGTTFWFRIPKVKLVTATSAVPLQSVT